MRHDFVLAMMKHLPPGASELRVLDVGAVVGRTFLSERDDLAITIGSCYIPHWNYHPLSMDAVTGFDRLLSEDFLRVSFDVLRPGGRLIVVNPVGDVSGVLVKQLESIGYTRILVESALETGQGVLIRGERPHETDDTLSRVRQISEKDHDTLSVSSYRGPYIHLLIAQSPNKPVWRLAEDEQIRWRAVGVGGDSSQQLIAFTSLPKAVSFMQEAILKSVITDVNKVGKFRRQVVAQWDMSVLLNPMLADVDRYAVQWIEVDPQDAEAPDE